MKIFFNGCSWGYGGELKEERLEKRYSRLVCNHFGAEEKNVSACAVSNENIIRHLLNPKKPKDDIDLVVIQMTYPARTEYHTGIPFAHGNINSGWIQISPKYTAHTLMRYKNSNEDTVTKVGNKEGLHFFGGVEHLKFWNDYYRTVTTKEFFDHKEMIQKITIENYCKVHNLPLVICTNNPETELEFDLQMNYKGIPMMPKGHPNVEGHRILADQIISIAESRL